MDWYVARTQSRREAAAKINLTNQGIACFYPQFWAVVRRRNAFEEKLKPLFPGYIFFQLGEDLAMMRAVRGTVGISYILSGDRKKPKVVPPEFMEQMLSSCVDGIISLRSDQVSVGDCVQINRGPFSGVLGTVLSLDDSSRAALFLGVMGGVKVKMRIAYFTPHRVS